MTPGLLRPFIDSSAKFEVEFKCEEARGKRKGRSWSFASATYRRLGEKAAHVPPARFRPDTEQDRMVLQYMKKQGRITRAKAAVLCKLSPDQACRLFRRLTDNGGLTCHGTKKSAWYKRIV